MEVGEVIDALEFIRERNRMCKSFGDECENCPANKDNFCIAFNVDEEIVPIVEKWSEEHPRKTRQSKFLEQYPNAKVDGRNVLCACPANIYGDEVCLNDSVFCSDCCRDFWMQEVE